MTKCDWRGFEHQMQRRKIFRSCSLTFLSLRDYTWIELANVRYTCWKQFTALTGRACP